MKLNSMFD